MLNLDIDIADSGTSTHGRLKLAMLQKNIGKRQKRKRCKTSKADERWKTHLPRSSVIQKYIANTKKCKTTWKPEDLRAKAGGYCALPCDLKKRSEIHSVQEAIELGFTVIECNDV